MRSHSPSRVIKRLFRIRILKGLGYGNIYCDGSLLFEKNLKNLKKLIKKFQKNFKNLKKISKISKMAKNVANQNAPIWLKFWSGVLWVEYEHLPKPIFVRIFYISFQRPSRTRALESVT